MNSWLATRGQNFDPLGRILPRRCHTAIVSDSESEVVGELRKQTPASSDQSVGPSLKKRIEAVKEGVGFEDTAHEL